MFCVEVKWNREFHWSGYGESIDTLDVAIAIAKEMMNSGDGARVKGVRVLDSVGKVVWTPYGHATKNPV